MNNSHPAPLASQNSGASSPDAHVIAVAPDLVEAVQTLRSLLITAMSGVACSRDYYAFEDAIARSGHLLLRAQGTDTTAIVARYEASLRETPDEDDAFDDDFGRYGRDD